MTRLSLAVALVLALVLPAVAADHPLLVTPAWVAERLGRADVRIIDLSDDAFQRLAPLGDGTIRVKVES